MEAKNSDPYEQQLLAVFESCLEKNETKLNENGLKLLCEKLELDEQTNELKKKLLKNSSLTNSSITFTDFRNGLLSILDKSQNSQELCDNNEDNEFEKYDNWSITHDGEKLRKICHKNNSNMNCQDINLMSNLFDNSATAITKEMIEQLFEKLDNDCDGMINFTEFFQLFQHNKILHEQLSNDWCNRTRTNHENSEKNIMTMLGPEQTGLIRSNSLINLWKLAGVSEPSELLTDLGFTNSPINLDELISILNDELTLLQNEPVDAIVQTHVNLLKSALILYQEELRTTATITEQLTGERDKLRIDIIEANDRANLLAQEIDENHMKIEKTKQEQIKQLEIKNSELIKTIEQQYLQERETHNNTVKNLSEQLKNLQYDEQQIRSKLADTIVENHKLESDNLSHIEQISKLKNSNNQLLMQVQVLTAEHDEAVDNDDNDNEQIIALVNRIKNLQDEVSLLRDQNDELTSELESIKMKNSLEQTAIMDTTYHVKSEFSDDNEGPNSVTTSEPLAEQEIDFKSNNSNKQFDSMNSKKSFKYMDEKKSDNLDNIISTITNDLKNLLTDKNIFLPDAICRKNINDVIEKLESYSSTKSSSSSSSIKCDDKKITKENEYEERTSESLRDLVVSKTEKTKLINKRISTSDDMIYNIDKNFNNLDIKNYKCRSLRDYPPKKDDSSTSELKLNDEKNSLTHKTTPSVDIVDGGDNNDKLREEKNRLALLLKEQEMKHSDEKKLLQEQCQELEKSLESLRTEYYRLEDYWADKLDEERQLVDQEQKISDEKLAELISKIAEYEEQFSASEKPRNDGRLSPIDEKVTLEQQYTDLQNEYDDYKRLNEMIIMEKNEEINKLEDKIDKMKNVEMKNISIQVAEVNCKKIKKSTSLPGTNNLLKNDVLTITQSVQSIPKIPYYGLNQKLFEPGKLNQITENSIINKTNLQYSQSQRGLLSNCYCQKIDKYTTIENDLQRILKIKYDTDNECCLLVKQKDNLVKEIIELKKKRDDCTVNNLTNKINNLEKKRKNLKLCLKQHKQHSDRVFDKMCKQHINEVDDLQSTLNSIQEKLKIQLEINSKQLDKLTKSDMLMKELFIENTCLKKQLDKLNEKFNILTNFNSESTSV